MTGTTIPPEFAHAVVIAAVRCRRCGYNLRSLRADGLCPECGLANWQSILHTVDPAASRLPSLRDPPGVGNALLWLMLCGLAATVIMIARPTSVWIDGLGVFPTVRLAHLFPPWTLFAAAGAVLAGLWSVYKLMPSDAEEAQSVRRDVLLLGGGITGWAAITTLRGVLTVIAGNIAPAQALALQIGGSLMAVLAFIGVRDVLRIIGERSREYRTSRGGRQSVEAIIAAIFGNAVGEVVRFMAQGGVLPPVATTLGTVVVVISDLMIVIGLVYLFTNSWWIRSALVKPPPGFDEVLMPPLPHDTTLIDQDDETFFEVKEKGEE